MAATSRSGRGEASVPRARSGSGHRHSGLVEQSAYLLARANGVVATNPVVATNWLRIGYGQLVATNSFADANVLGAN